MSLRSAEFDAGSSIPRRCGYKNGNHTPALEFGGAPAGTTSLALIMDDPDAMGAVGKVWVHWTVWNIPPDASTVTGKYTEGKTDFGDTGYGGPAPPDKRHTYVFALYALDRRLDLKSGSEKIHLDEAMRGHVLEKAELRGTYEP